MNTRIATTLALASLLAACAASTGIPDEVFEESDAEALTGCADSRMLAARRHLISTHGPAPGAQLIGDSGAAAVLSEMFANAYGQGWTADQAMQSYAAVTHGYRRADFTVLRAFTQFGKAHPCRLDSSYLLADPADMRDPFDEDGTFNQVFHTLAYIYAGYFIGFTEIVELENLLHEALDAGHWDDFVVADAGILLGRAVASGKTLREVLTARYSYYHGSTLDTREHYDAYVQIHGMLDGDPLYDTPVTWSNFSQMVDFVLSDGGTPIADVEWVRCARDTCPVHYGPDMWGSLTLMGNVPRGTEMGVMVRSGWRATVSYPMTDRQSQVQIIRYVNDGWVAGPYRAHGPQPTDDRARLRTYCAAGSCPVYYGRDSFSETRVLGHQPRCTAMGIFVSDAAKQRHIVSYPMGDMQNAVQFVPIAADGWTTTRPSGC